MTLAQGKVPGAAPGAVVDNIGLMAARPPSQPLDARGEKRRSRAQMLDFSTIGMVFPISLLIGYFGGMKVGSWLDAASLGSWIGLTIGFFAGFYNLWKMILLIERREAAARDDGSLDDD